MKRIFMLIIIFLTVLSLYSEKITVNEKTIEFKTSSVELQGAYEEALNMNINPIAAQTESFLSGMPFNIEEEFVKYNRLSDGRAIATWNVLSNTRFNIYIRAERMYHVNDTNYNYPLDYILTFSYNLAYPNLNNFNGAGSFYVTSNEPVVTGAGTIEDPESALIPLISIETPQGLEENFYKINLFDDFTDAITSGFTGSVDGSVYFKFTSDSTDALHGTNKDNYKSGDYTAIVKFFVEGVE